jgi:hypothetical protein
MFFNNMAGEIPPDHASSEGTSYKLMPVVQGKAGYGKKKKILQNFIKMW